ncbi:MAG: DUF4258 domain-containing protein [Actinobacteria bacterium]|nr:DUF4258 domain-containing protein [Actinomycetota bacterium]
MQFTRHARNGMRRLGVTRADVAAILLASEAADRDPDGRPRHLGIVDGRRIRIVLALEDPSLVVSVHERRR